MTKTYRFLTEKHTHKLNSQQRHMLAKHCRLCGKPLPLISTLGKLRLHPECKRQANNVKLRAYRRKQKAKRAKNKLLLDKV